MRRQIRTQRHSTESYRVCRARHVGLSPSMVTKEAAAGHVRRSCGGWRRLHWPLVHTASHTLPHLRSQQSAVSSQSSATTLQNSLRESHGAGEMAVGRTLAGEWQGREVVLCGLTTSVLLRPLLLALQPRSTPASLRAIMLLPLLPGSRLGRRRVGDKLLSAPRRPVSITHHGGGGQSYLERTERCVAARIPVPWRSRSIDRSIFWSPSAAKRMSPDKT